MSLYYRIMLGTGLLVCIIAVPFLIAEGEWDALLFIGPHIVVGLVVLVISLRNR